MSYILCWSGGKDSTATAILAKELGIKIKAILCATPDPFREELEFKNQFEDFMGMKVITTDVTYEQLFFRIKQRGKYKGTIYGWPMTIYKSCANHLKWIPMNKTMKEINLCGDILLGISSDEAKKRPIKKGYRSLLIEQNMSQQDAYDFCKQYGLLNPMYAYFNRLGCVRCPKQSIYALSKVAELEPDKWRWMWNVDILSPVSFKPDKTFRAIATKLGLVP